VFVGDVISGVSFWTFWLRLLGPGPDCWIKLFLGFPHGIESIEKILKFQNCFSRPWKSIEFCSNVH